MSPSELLEEQAKLRAHIVDRLRTDLMGPSSLDETIEGRPGDRYMTGLLHPQDSSIGAEDDDGVDSAGGEEADVEEAVPLVATMKPSSAGLSFSVRGPSPTLAITIRAGAYRLAGDGESRESRRWARRDLSATIDVVLSQRVLEESLEDRGIPGMRLYVQQTEDGHQRHNVTVAIINAQARGETRNESEERTFFQTEVDVRPGSGTELVARPSRKHASDEDGRAAELIYRDAKEMAAGHTCAATWDLDGDVVTAVRTTWLPHATVPATSPLGDEPFAALKSETLSADWLGRADNVDLAEALRSLVNAYRRWIADKRAAMVELPEAFQRQASLHMEECERAASRMEASIVAIEHNGATRVAFQLAQRAMDLQRQWSEGRALVWRPFQLGFQLLVLAGLADRSHADRAVMDLLWFPTGGGKTEAYLALTAFCLFHRRLAEPDPDVGAGVAVLMRYTLRLLTVQQFQRAAAMVLASEHLRRTQSAEPLGTKPFSIGLWVGSGATPNSISDAMRNTGGSTHRQLTACPCCKGALDWDFPQRRSRVRCVGGDPCVLRSSSPAGLPVWTIDEDIYREPPSLLIATVDKLAQIVRRPESGALFGLGTPHPPPDLIIQDELHLISGPLGTVTGLYETAIDVLCSRGETMPKVIGSTATIRRASEQIRALFARRAFQFPPPGLDDRSSGFAVVDPQRPGRLYLGVSTAGRSAKFAAQAVAAALLQAVASRPELPAEVRDPYWTLVAYYNTLRELGGSLVLMQDDVPVTMRQLAARHAGERPRDVQPPAELTSRVSSGQIRAMLDELALRCDRTGAHDILLASNMISVGVDIPRLGEMMVVGQPKTVSEYIQATSRVGRASPGLVVALYNAGRVRDRAHFETFASWHRTLYREVEATSVTPFASRAQDKALHAVLVTLVRHLVPGMSNSPVLSPAARAQAEKLVRLIEDRAKYVDPGELKAVGERLRKMLDVWRADTDLQSYWDDYGKTRSLLMSAEQYAAQRASGGDATRALWPTPSSMREVEPGTPFALVTALRIQEGGTDAAE